MRLMVFSDIHGNFEALQSVLKDAEEKNVHRSICIGDLIGYGPYPNECIDLARTIKKCRFLSGNHDVAALWQTSPYGISASAKEAILWTMDQLSEKNKKFLKELPNRIELPDMTFAHANPYNPRGWRYVLDRKYALRSFAATSCRHLFIGHSHRPLVITRKHFFSIDLQKITDSPEIRIKDKKRRIINCGSVGQPRDRDTRACYLIFDTSKQAIEFYRVTYDIEKTVQAIRSANLPVSIHKRLLKGI